MNYSIYCNRNLNLLKYLKNKKKYLYCAPAHFFFYFFTWDFHQSWTIMTPCVGSLKASGFVFFVFLFNSHLDRKTFVSTVVHLRGEKRDLLIIVLPSTSKSTRYAKTKAMKVSLFRSSQVWVMFPKNYSWYLGQTIAPILTSSQISVSSVTPNPPFKICVIDDCRNSFPESPSHASVLWYNGQWLYFMSTHL